MPMRERPSGYPAGTIRPSWGGIADAVGHCVLVFAFAPTLAAIPSWLVREVHNRLNADDLVVLAFLPVRGLVVLLNAFAVGAPQGVLEGVLAGVLVVMWCAGRGVGATWRERSLLGAICGMSAAGALIGAVVAWQAVRPGPTTFPAAAVAFEIGSGMACGMLAVPGTLRLLSASAT